MNLRFTRHARNRMRRDRVAEVDIRQCLENPDSSQASVRGRTNFTRRFDGTWLRVTAIEEGDEMVIITVTQRKA